MIDVGPKGQSKTAKQLVVFKFNNWNFYDISLLEFTPSSRGNRSKYCIMPFSSFGVVDQFETNPANIMMMGKTGDYLFVDTQGTLIIIDKSIGQYYV
jgi:hypothetical protein